MKRTKIICPDCGQEISKSNFSKHERRHRNHPETFKVKQSFKLNHDGLDCQFCGKTCKNRNSLCNHERLCKDNPSRQISQFTVFNTSQGHTVWNKGLTKQTDIRVAQQSETLKESYKSGKALNQGGFKKYSAQKCKYGTYKGFYCDSSWELAFLMYCLDKGIQIQRNTQAFDYIYKDKPHKYYPDFLVDDTFIEIKGRLSKQDIAKIEQFPLKDKFKLINSSNINMYINYAINTYGSNFATLYDRNFPCWLDKIDNTNKLYNFKLRDE